MAESASEMLTYENEEMMERVKDAVRPCMKEDETLVWRDAFRWKDENGIMNNCYDSQDIDYICETFGYELVHNFHHVAVINKL